MSEKINTEEHKTQIVDVGNMAVVGLAGRLALESDSNINSEVDPEISKSSTDSNN